MNLDVAEIGAVSLGTLGREEGNRSSGGGYLGARRRGCLAGCRLPGHTIDGLGDIGRRAALLERRPLRDAAPGVSEPPQTGTGLAAMPIARPAQSSSATEDRQVRRRMTRSQQKQEWATGDPKQQVVHYVRSGRRARPSPASRSWRRPARWSTPDRRSPAADPREQVDSPVHQKTPAARRSAAGCTSGQPRLIVVDDLSKPAERKRISCAAPPRVARPTPDVLYLNRACSSAARSCPTTSGRLDDGLPIIETRRRRLGHSANVLDHRRPVFLESDLFNQGVGGDQSRHLGLRSVARADQGDEQVSGRCGSTAQYASEAFAAFGADSRGVGSGLGEAKACRAASSAD